MENEWIKLGDLRPGAVFTTQDGIEAVKSEYHYGNGAQCQCVLLASGEYAHFPDKNDTLVKEIERENLRGGMKIIATKRTGDIHVCLEGKPGIWAAGKTLYEAIGDLIQHHEDSFDIAVEWNTKDDWTRRYVEGDPLTRN